ncbi:MAG: IclR family transcriptional regulator [Variovorax sp.]
MASGIERGQRGIQSIEVGGELLRALVHTGRPMPLKDLARDAGMTAAKAHPYMVSYGRLGLIEQDDTTGHYALGPLALQLGLIGLQQANPIQIATPLIDALARQIGHTVALAVWGDRGATIVRIAESAASVHVSLRHGTVFSLANTASGRLFGAYLDPLEVKRLLADEREHGAPSWKDFEVLLREVRAHGISRSEGEIVPGVSAMAAPVFDHTGRIVLAIAAIGPAGIFDTAWDGALAEALRACGDAVSQRLGAARR